MLPDNCNLVIIGGGPAGLTAGLEALKHGLSVTLIEKDESVGKPLNCAEAVSIPSIEYVTEVEENWIRATIHKARLVSPSGYEVLLNHPDAGFILNRPIMEQALADRFVASGGLLLTGTRVSSIGKKGGLYKAVTVVESDGKVTTTEADFIIAADGVEGTIARMAGIENRLELKTTVAYLQYHLKIENRDQELIELHIGNKLAPGSYLWVFPHGKGELSIGLGCSVCSGQRPVDLLDRFVKKEFPGAEIYYRCCGTTPVYQGEKVMAKENLLVVGDAARLLDSVSGAGITNAMLSGKLAGKAVAAGMEGGRIDLKVVHEIYPGGFIKAKGRELQLYSQVKKMFDRLNDSELDDLVETLAEVVGKDTVRSINALEVFFNAVRRKPRLLKLARHLLF